jgi:hypothetical protein
MMYNYATVPIVNPGDADWTRHLYLMWAGAYGDIKCYVWANSFDDAFEHLVEWLDDNAPGCLTWVDYDSAALELDVVSNWRDIDEECEKVREHAEMDLSVVGHTTLTNGDAIPSWEWGGDEIIDAATIEAVKALCADPDDNEDPADYVDDE